MRENGKRTGCNREGKPSAPGSLRLFFWLRFDLTFAPNESNSFNS
jgi:hypothetical protein